ncbi:MAG: FtsK/SpoIIIE domain-containing protein [Acidimicrobiia bacterium]
MEVSLTVVSSDRSKDLTLDLDEGTTGEEVLAAIAAKLPFPLGGRALVVNRTGLYVSGDDAVDLLYGDALQATADNTSSPKVATFLGVATSFQVSDATSLIVGREVNGPGAVRLVDKTVSSRHASISMRGGNLTVEDLGSSNGTWVNDQRITTPRHLTTGDVVEFGDSSQFTVTLPEAMPPPYLRRSGSVLEFAPPPRELTPEPTLEIELEAPPEPRPRRRIPTAAIAAPVAFGFIGYILLESPTILAFAALSPVMALWNWWEDRRAGTTEFRRLSAQFQDRLSEVEQDLHAFSDTYRKWLGMLLPSQIDVGRRIAALSPTLWQRRPPHDDYLHVRIGTANKPSPARVRVDRRGDPRLQEQSQVLLKDNSELSGAPLGVDLDAHRVFGIIGSPMERRGLARSIVAQIAAHHSPRDVVMVGLAPESSASLSPWYPHVREAARQGLSPMPADTVEAAESFNRLRRLAGNRLDHDTRPSTNSEANGTVVVLIEPPLPVQRREVLDLMGDVDAAKLVAIWLVDSENDLPAECTAVVNLEGHSLRLLRSAERTDGIDFETLEISVADRLARRLSPLSDVSASDIDKSIPKMITLGGLLPDDIFEPNRILERWSRPPPGLSAVVGVAEDGPLTVDLSERGEGPHGLVAGTTGAGKSEFLQTLVASLAANYPPDLLTFLFVDYKGGSAFRECVALPHCVGVVTNLDAGLSDRVRRSLLAEREYRERVLDRFGAGDLNELRAARPDDAPPTLLIVFDEFAALTAEIPEFIDAVVDIAQKGRSLGMHLLLATQTPGGAVGPKIQNCVSLRVGLRLKDSNESASVIGSPLAASIPAGAPGRAYARLGDNSLVQFQAAFAGSQHVVNAEASVSARTIFGERTSTALISSGSGLTELEAFVSAAQEAHRESGLLPQRRPWLPELSDSIALSDLSPREPWPKTLIGLADLPDQQIQTPYTIDWMRVRNCLIIGAGGSGKTTTLNTIAVAAAQNAELDTLNLLVLNSGGRDLDRLSDLPHVRAVVGVHNTTHLRRALAEISQRISEGQSSGAVGNKPALLILVDGLVGILSTLEDLDGGRWMPVFQQQMIDGPAAGVHFAITTDQPQRIQSSILNSCGERIVLRLNNLEAYNAAGIGRSAGSQLTVAGRGWSTDQGAVIQVAKTPDQQHFDLNMRFVSEIAAGRVAPVLSPVPIDIPLATLVSIPDEPAVLIGLDDELAAAQSIDVVRSPTLVVIGPDLSGRTTLLATVRRFMEMWDKPLRSVLLAPSEQSDIHRDRAWTERAFGLEAVAEATEAIVTPGRLSDGWTLVAIDDGDDFAENPIGRPSEETQSIRRIGEALDVIVRRARETQTVVVAAGRFPSMSRLSGWASRMRQNGQGLILAPSDLVMMSSEPTFGARIPRRSEMTPTPGRGLLIRQGRGVVVQVPR